MRVSDERARRMADFPESIAPSGVTDLAIDLLDARAEIARLQGQTHFDPNAELQARLDEARALLDAVRPTTRWSVLVWDWLWNGRCAGSEDAWELSELAEKCGLAERVAYDPEKHGESEAGEGDTILYPSNLPASVREWASAERNE